MAESKTTRSIKVGLIIKDKESMKRLIDSHDFFGYCVKYYTDLLLEMRGGDVYIRNPLTGDETIKKASEYQEALCNRMKEAAKRNGNSRELTPKEVESFISWCQNYYNETINASNPKGSISILQNSEIKVEAKSGRSSSLIYNTRELIKNNTSILRELNAPNDIILAGEKIKEGKANAEAIATWIFNNKSLCLEHFPSDKINKICELYLEEQENKAKNRQNKESSLAEFGMSGIRVLPLIQKTALLYVKGLDSEIKNISSWYYGAWTIAVQRLKSWNT